MPVNRSFFALLSFLAAFLFFILAAFGVALADVRLIPAGLTALAAGLIFVHAPTSSAP